MSTWYRVVSPAISASSNFRKRLSGKIVFLLLFYLILAPLFSTAVKADTSPPLAIDQAHMDSIGQAVHQKIKVTHHSPGQGSTSHKPTNVGKKPKAASLPAYNNVGTSDDSNAGSANIDGNQGGYSAQALAAAKLTPGQNFQIDGVTFMWPDVQAGSVNNYVVNGQVLPVTPVAGATTLAFLGTSTNGATSGVATLTYSDNSTQAFTLGMSDWILNNGQDQPSYGNLTAATMPYHNAKSGKQNVKTYLFCFEVNLQSGKTLQSVTLPNSVNQGQLHIFAVSTRAPYNNIGSSDDSATNAGNFDGDGASYSNQALAKAGLNAGQKVTYNNTDFIWPNVAAGVPNNILARGQTIPVTPVANALTVAFLGASTHGNSSGQATLTYTDNSTQTFTLSMSDWTLGGGSATLATGNSVAFTTAYRNAPKGAQTLNTYLFYEEIALQTSKSLLSVTLPASVNQGELHIFAIGTRNQQVPGYNNVGTTDDGSPAAGNFDSNSSSYSAQALQSAGLTAGKQVAYDGIFFTWPNIASGAANNYQASGQTLPITPVPNAVKLGFLGASAFASTSGTAIITYSDGSTQSFTLGISDWLLSSNNQTHPAFGNGIVATTNYYNNSSGKQNLHSYIFASEVDLQVGKTIESVQLPSSLNQGQMHIFATGTRSYFNNVGISDGTNSAVSDFDTNHNTYSSQEISDTNYQNWQPCDDLNYNGMDFTWPCTGPNTADNYQAQGQTIPVSGIPNSDMIGFVGAASYGPSSGTATVNYTDGSTQSFTLAFSDWTLTGFSQALSYQNRLFAALKHRSTPQGLTNGNTFIYYTEQKLQLNKTVQSVTLPASTNQGQLHVFSIATRATSNFNNSVGATLDEAPIFGSFDNTDKSYSTEALKTAGITPGQNFFFNGIQFNNWTDSLSAIPDHYVAQGQTIPISPVDQANTLAFIGSATYGSASGLATVTYTDNSTQSFTLGLTDWFSTTINYNNLLVANMTYHNTPTGKENGNTYLYYADTPLQAGKTIQSVTLPASTSPGFMHIFAIGTRGTSLYNNVGITDDGATTAGTYDAAVGSSYSAQTLQQAGITPGATVTYNGVSFTWPNIPSNTFDNYQANGQTISVSPVANANTLAFLGSSTHNDTSGTATINYTDNTTQTFTLGLTNWWSGTPEFNNTAVAVLPYINTPSGKRTGSYYLYYTETSLQAGKTVRSVTLPTSVSGGELHVFSVGTRAGVYYNNVGTSDDNNPTFASFDTGGISYSAQALQGGGIVPGANFNYNGTSFTWPNASAGSYNNYLASGQTVAVNPVANTDTIGFIGASTGASLSGSAIINYTGGSTQAFTLGMTDWWNGTPQFSNLKVMTLPYLNTATGKRTGSYYLYYAEVSVPISKTVQSVTLPNGFSNGQLHIFAIGTRAASAYNNAGVNSDTAPYFSANYDGTGDNYSEQALQAAGIKAGQGVTYNGVTFTWPSPAAGIYNNYQVNGQTVPITPVANDTTLAFLGSSTHGSTTGTGTITYSDGSTQTFTLSLTDWAVSPTAYGNAVVATMPYFINPNGKDTDLKVYLFYTDIPLQAGKTVQSVKLPPAGGQGQMHVFAMGTK